MVSHAHNHPPSNPVLDHKEPETRYRLHRRFDRLGRLFGDGAVQKLMEQRVCLFGAGGVGSFAAEALVRSAIGKLQVVDFDDVCITNSNRQLQALHGNVGKPKTWILRDRLRLINPQAQIEARRAFYNAARADELLTVPAAWAGGAVDQQWDYVVDAIDNLTAKAHLLAECRRRGIPIISSMGAAGKLDPTQLRIADLADATHCHLARELRSILRKKYDLPKTGPMGIQVVFSTEERHWPKELSYDNGEGFSCVCPATSVIPAAGDDDDVRAVREDQHSCDEKTIIDGTVAYVTGAFGLACASAVINAITASIRDGARPATTKFDQPAAREVDSL
ncbi:MAG: tRNA threonylcarbamoyladenosine dehydratase [Deltaproteobacteria bacterium]|nr:tRNA threonylcarbamoyladenosine dehydratase [Deltaproteobacteria bacterium]